MELFILCIKVFGVRILDVSLGTFRMINVVKGKRKLASVIGFIEVLIWFLIVKEALNTTSNSIWIAISYSLGFAVGTYTGGFFSEKFIEGTLTLQVILSKNDDELVDAIRSEGYAVSVIDVKGQMRDKAKYMLFIEINKKSLKHVTGLIRNLDKKAFIVVNETKLVHNGFIK